MASRPATCENWAIRWQREAVRAPWDSEPGHDEAADDRPWPRLPLGAAYVWLLFVAYELSSGLVLDAESTCDLAQLLAVESRPGQFRDWLENFLLGGPAGLLFAFYYAPRALGL